MTISRLPGDARIKVIVELDLPMAEYLQVGELAATRSQTLGQVLSSLVQSSLESVLVDHQGRQS
jgi:hypothetical protein